MEISTDNKFEESLQPEQTNKFDKLRMLKIIGITATSLILITTVFLIGYFQFGWFQKSQDNVISSVYRPYQVLLFNEFKTISTAIDTKNGKESVDQVIKTDFLVVINSKTKLNYFGVIDYLYNATIVIMKTKANDKVVGGLDLTEQEESEIYFNNPEKQIEHPLAKFSFYENGTLANIYLVKDNKEFYATHLVDLIEQIIPRISKKIYNKKNKKVEFTYDEDNEHSTEKTISEDHQQKEFVDKYSKIAFKGSQVNKKIKRKINNDTIEQVKTESELNLISKKPEENEKDKFYDIGLNGYSIKVNSDLAILENKIDKKLIEKIDSISKKFKYEESQKLLEELSKKEMGQISKIIEKAENTEKENSVRSLENNVEEVYDLTSINVLGKKIDFKYLISYVNGKSLLTFRAIIGKVVVQVNSASTSATSSLRGGISTQLCNIPFTLGIPLTFTLNAVGDYHYNFVFQTSYKKENTAVSVAGTLNAKLDGSLSTKAPFISLELGASGKILELTGNKRLDLFSRKISGSMKATTGPFSLFVDVKVEKKTYHKDLIQMGTISKNF